MVLKTHANSYTKPLFLLWFIASLNLFVEISDLNYIPWKFYKAQEEQKSAQMNMCIQKCIEIFFSTFRYLIQINLLKGPVVSESLLHSPTSQHPHCILFDRNNCQIIREEKFIESNLKGPHKVRSRYHWFYIIFASAPI